MKVLIENVGRSKASWEIETWGEPNIAADAVYKSVIAKKVLMSRDVDVSLQEDGKGGGIFAGMRQVGSWRFGEATRSRDTERVYISTR